MKTIRLACGFFGIIFVIMLSFRVGLFEHFFAASKSSEISTNHSSSEIDSWMNIVQDGRKIGYSHTVFSQQENDYHLQETMVIRINTMGMVQDIELNIRATLNTDYTLSKFNFEVRSGPFQFSADGQVKKDVLAIETQSADDASRRMEIKVKDKIYVLSGLMRGLRYDELEPGKTFTFQIFDPISMSRQPVLIEVLGEEDVMNMGIRKRTKKLAMTYAGASQNVWLGEGNDIIKEKGMLGISFEKTNRENVLFGSNMASSRDLTAAASVPSNVNIEDVGELKTLKLEISGVARKKLYLDGGRQTLAGNVLTITKERLTDLELSLNQFKVKGIEKEFLAPSPFIQSDHPKIKNLVKTIVSKDESPLQNAHHIIDWIHKHIKKKPTLSLPDALSTLTHGVGDCNEHAVLLAAMARAAGIPAKIETGLVYLDGRFYYHAWNLLYLGEWITADALFNQLPADVTHVRLLSGTSSQQFDLINVIGRIKLRIVASTR